MPKQVVVIGGGPSAKHLVEKLVKQKDLQITQIQANPFVEWPIAMPAVLTMKPHMYAKVVAPNPETFQVKGVVYKYGPVTSVSAAEKTVQFRSAAGAEESVPYDALAVCTGFGCPLIYPKVGVSLAERKAEVEHIAASILKAKTIVVHGGGLIAVEFAGGAKSAYPNKTVVMVTRDGILKSAPEKMARKTREALTKLGVKLVTGSAEGAPEEPELVSGSLTVNNESIPYDIFLPMFGKGPNTQFLSGIPGILDEKGRVRVNEFLQSCEHPAIFAVGVGDTKDPFVGFVKLEGHWNCVAANIKAHLADAKMKPYKEAAPNMTSPPVIFYGTGKGAWGAFDFNMLPPPLKCCCCCGLGGFPCCPPPCCWCCCKPCCCGYCGGAPEGNGVALALENMPFKASGFHFKGIGEAPKQQSMS
jgi:NADH dehydrogenase FAD-containing subunit